MINFELSENLIEEFNNNGFLILDNFLDLNYIDDLRNKFEPLFKGNFETGIEPDEWNWKFGKDPKDVTRQICNAWKADHLIKKIVCHEIIGEVCSRLMNWKGARLVQDNVLWKPPGGKTLGFHQDAAYDDWLIPQTMMTCWMSLDDTSRETGTLEYIKGSHKWGLQPPKGEFHSPEDYKKELNIFAE
ncbi:MAG: phytanoyl-CoA dioxygenase family protein, partial [Proteobacteria bacterium]|nr:phytanoyl-CoA dioxygenase family protein [Pseudomonadota bacterium]